ncbi:hypothetical protein PkP19E3_17580 [Pseudomonas koreensis]|nr:hypothetical protein PkP19E3_17580 [Pseudomonas koreensis]
MQRGVDVAKVFGRQLGKTSAPIQGLSIRWGFSFLEVEMADIENRLTSLESSVNEILVEIRGIKLEILAAKGESDAAAPLLEQRLQKVESAVGLFELG